jgi:hypothetical protein
MGLLEERLQQTVLRLFGPTARLNGSFGTVAQPGQLEIVVGNKQIGVGATFQAALQAASRQLATTRC